MRIVQLLLLVILTTLLAGVWGILHDLVTYTISPEYFTKFKFMQFGIDELPLNVIAKVALIGWMATWWLGLLLGFIYSATVFILPRKRFWRIVLKGIRLNFYSAVLAAFIGYILGVVFANPSQYNLYLPENIVDTRAFLIVGNIHNLSYFGAIVGLIVGLRYCFNHRKNLSIDQQLPKETT